MTRTSADVTRLLRQWHGGDQDAFGKPIPAVYDELRGLAKRHMRRQTPGHTLQTTALLHEAYLKIARHPEVDWHNRAHFWRWRKSRIRRTRPVSL